MEKDNTWTSKRETMGWIHARAKKIEFGDMNRTFEELAAGKIEGRAVLIPSKS